MNSQVYHDLKLSALKKSARVNPNFLRAGGGNNACAERGLFINPLAMLDNFDMYSFGGNDVNNSIRPGTQRIPIF